MKPLLQKWLLLFLFPATLCTAQVAEILPSKEYNFFTEGISIYPVCEGEAPNIEQVSQPDFQVNFRSDSVFLQGCKHWVKVRMVSTAHDLQQYLLTNADRLGVTKYYFPQKNGSFIERKNGLSVAPDERAVNFTGYRSTPFMLAPNDTTTVFILQDYPNQAADQKIVYYTKAIDYDFFKKEHTKITEVAVTCTALLLLVLYNLSVYFFVKDKAYLFYSLTFLFLIPYILSINIMAWQWVKYTDFTHYTPEIMMICGMLAGASYLVFSMSYLQAGRTLTLGEVRIKKVTYGFSLFYIANSSLILIYGYGPDLSVFSLVADIIFLFFVFLLFAYSIWLSLNNNQTARYYVLASLCSLPFLAVYFMQGPSTGHHGLLGWIPGNAFTRASLKIGVVVQALTFSVALAARINLMRNRIASQQLEVEKAEREKLETVNQLIEKQKIELEQKVQERTISLQEAIEELRISEENLANSNQTKDRLFAVVAHDLRGPITSFQGVSKLLNFQIKKNRPEKVAELAERMDESANQLNTLLDNLLKWAQTQMGGIELHPQELKLRPIVDDILSIYENTASAKGIAVTCQIEPQNLSVLADEATVSTVLRNLWSNALKFTENGEVALKAFAETDKVWIEITDSGVGIAPDKLDKLFEIGSAKSTKGTQGEKGNGFGLYLCKEFVERNGGEIFVESTAGKGTSMRFWLPLFN